jgi:hypothetical protein
VRTIQCFRMPGVEFGRFVVYPRTDGTYCVVDPLRPMGDRIVEGSIGTLGHATTVCQRQALMHPGDLEVGDD